MRSLPAILFLSLVAPLAMATSFTVNSEADVGDDSPGDDVCHAVFGLPGVCTLRAAVQEANAHSGVDTIFLSAGQVYTLTRSGLDDTAVNGDLDITDDVSIVFFASGTRPVVDVNGLERAFEVHNDANLTLFGFDITGGRATVLTAEAGGAVAVNFDSGIVLLSYMRLYGNRANFGGGLYNDGAETTLAASEVYDNQAASDYADSGGAAVFNRGTLTIDKSSLFLNTGVGHLAALAVYNTPPFTGSPLLTVINSTIATNLGIGIESEDNSTLVVRNSTIADNSTGIYIKGTAGTFQMRDSVVARNSSKDCTVSVVAALNLDRYNMDSDDTCELSGGSSNYPGVDPQLTPLARHGGFTHVAWPLTDSPMIDTAHPVIGSIGCESDDEHFQDRPVDFDGDGNARCDVGAIELSDDVIFHDPFDRL